MPRLSNSSKQKTNVSNEIATDIKRCSRCIIPTSLPSVETDSKGICNHCHKYEIRYANDDNTKEERKKKFENIVYRAKKLDRPYDCIVTLSGGKDSTYSLYLASKVYGLKCVAITFDNGYLSRHALNNIKAATEIAGAEHIFYTFNRNTMLRLYKMSLMKSGIICAPCMKGIEVCGIIATKTFNPPLFMHGNSAKIGYMVYPEIFAGGEIFGSLIKDEPIAKEAEQLIAGDRQKVYNAMKRLIFRNSFMAPRVMCFHDYFDVSRDELYDTIRREMGWTAPDDPEHMDCLIHEVPFYVHGLKFPELTKKTAFLSGQIRLGEMEREEALDIETKELAEKKKPAILDSFLSELDMSEDEFMRYASNWKNVDLYRDKARSSLVSLYHRIVKG